MSSINFVVRTGAGASQNGTMSVNGENAIIDVTQANEVSLNLRQSDIRGYQRMGEDLEITLSDGRVISLVNYFAPGGGDSRLFVSADGYLSEVTLSEGEDGAVYAQYAPAAEWGKWSPSDDLIFLEGTEVASADIAGVDDQEVSMLGVGLLGGSSLLGLAGAGAAAAVVAGAALSGEDGTGRVPPTVDQTDDMVVGGDEVTPINTPITISGTAEPGSTVDVTIGDEVVTTTSVEDGNWEVVFEDETFPDDGTHDVVVVVTEPDGVETTLPGPVVVIDTTPPLTDVTEGTVGSGDIFNAEEFKDGVEITGTGETGTTITVTVEGETRETTVEEGEWSVTFEEGTLPEGEYDTAVTIVASDVAGNTTTIHDTVRIDTVPNEVTIKTGEIEGDGVINAAEAADGVDVVGTATPGAVVDVTFRDQTETVTADANGDWTATFDGTTLESGEYDAEITATSTDVAGNVNTTTGTVQVDTLVRDFAVDSTTGGADGVINAEEITEGLTVSGTVEPGATVTVSFGTESVDAIVASDGSWSADFTSDQIPAGTLVADMVTTATDAAGNVQTITTPVSIDTDPNALGINTGSIEGDGVVNAAEATDGVQVTGTATPGAEVSVTFQDVTQTVVADDAGAWSSTFNVDLPSGQYDAEITATSTDAAGNVSTETGTIQVDTVVQNFAITSTAGGADGIVNAAEAAEGLTVSGTVEPGATVVLDLNGESIDAVVSADGSWTASFAPGQIPTGTQVADLVATATDAAGNTATADQSITVDTEVQNFDVTSQTGGADGVINATEAGNGLVVTGSGEPGSQVSVKLGTQTVQAVVEADGSWAAGFDASQIPEGTYTTQMVATATDAAGNTSIVTNDVDVDTVAGLLTLNGSRIGGDGTINHDESQAGVQVTGQALQGTEVTVTLDGVTHTTIAGAGNVWKTTYAPDEIVPGTHPTEATATITDAAGNTAHVSATVQVDTVVDNLNMSPPSIATGSDGQDVINDAVANAGFDVTGTVEAGSTVTVTIDGVAQQAVVDGDGNWVATFPGGALRSGEYDADVTVNVKDPAGNVSSLSDTVRVDTLVNTLSRAEDQFGGDMVINAAEARNGATLTGEVEPGSTVKVGVLGNTYDAVVAADGTWSLNIPAGDIPSADDDFAMVVTATDAAGNARSVNDTLSIDTIVPDQPEVIGYFREGTGYRSVTLDTPDEAIDIHRIASDGSVNEVAVHESVDAFLGETDYHFLNDLGATAKIPDGSQLIVTSTDDAGNASGTYVVLDETRSSVVDMGNANLGDFQIETVDLRFGDRSDLTLTKEMIEGLSDASDTLVVHGGADDTVTITGAVKGGTVDVEGDSHTVYTLDDTVQVLVDDDITNVII
ncbi:Ig-like domain-containing protein [Rhodobacteraceae bacterium KMM 6894]|nr:Ig-like domain-containing protein [Rhodobacteraceae bacterium KMM 6894]